ncbi:DUF3108 domain-containing protein [Methylobacterium oxalidis]|uniref:DUF3108 domain-containing protein n=1 Tax=Methylobacterium oxalidis TaxID=944322 RepID=A0A512J4V5_9HYPH|nr:DUF3108 domain-containing protein [Methylobacterium oxalidis]GEP04962.1 hypothetical protein MOX02_30000 [Methylobacterium oxalidis]GJE35538.1 hypothetical protein LDDCCGHA_5757 [Methylobacterium oxalidis]GLS63699.1 hypothetical protein GCM10007888_20800 [Methylobacterium oxalidis]
MCATPSIPVKPARQRIAAALCLLAAAGTGAAEARPRAPKAAPASVTVDYGVVLAGLPIGTAHLSGAFEGQRYRVDVSATLTGLVGAITGGMGSARSSGVLSAGPQPSTFSIATRTSNSGIAVRMALARGNVTQSEVTPPLIDMGDRVPVTAANKRGVMDPASALLMPARATGELTDPENCNRTLPVFDGATRFNVVLSYAETRAVEKPGYSGPVLVCNARYQAIAGHRPDRPGVRFMEENRDMSVWLAPVEGTRVLLPMRISVRTTIGTNIIEATRWTRAASSTAAATAAAPAEPAAVASLAGQD